MDEYVEFADSFRSLTGIDLGLYKRPQMERRLIAFREKLGFASFPQLILSLQQDQTLLHQFLDRMTINISEFFRNPERWEALIPFLKAVQTNEGPLQVWSAACSTGEEPYTFSIMLREMGFSQFKVLATDIDRHVLLLAKQAQYKLYQLRSVPKTYLDKYFQQKEDVWILADTVKTSVQFQKHNLLADKFPEPLDLIICRNVLIYFTEEAKLQVVSGFANALKPGGLLFVGSTEQFFQSQRLGLESVAPFLYKKMR